MIMEAEQANVKTEFKMTTSIECSRIGAWSGIPNNGIGAAEHGDRRHAKGGERDKQRGANDGL
jgi:hypothetical protein